MSVRTGLSRLDSGRVRLPGHRIGLVCNQATIDDRAVHILDALLPLHREGLFEIAAVFGPQHGIWGHTQDNMIEWEGYLDPRTGIPFHSLYGEHREPTDAMLEGIDLLVVDLPDIGTRYYTFLWTLALCMKACERLGTPVLVLDRPNPIGGHIVDGTVLDPAFESFVGLYPLPMRHGMTLGEFAGYMRAIYFPKCRLEVVEVEGWDRRQWFDETGLFWAMPSPNMPSLETALVYPGMCLIEGTRLSEGRGTTRPFEIFGAPYIDGWSLADKLNAAKLPGVVFRPIQFQPTFQKYAGEVCEGCFIHVTDRERYPSVLVAVAVLRQVVEDYRRDFRWLDPPYEYEYEKMPIDILAGNSWLREAIEVGTPLSQIDERMQVERESFAETRRQFLVYR